MYNFKVINIGILDKTFSEACFIAVSDTKAKLNSTTNIVTNLENGNFVCNGSTEENLYIMKHIRRYFHNRKYVEGVDYTINVLIEN